MSQGGTSSKLVGDDKTNVAPMTMNIMLTYSQWWMAHIDRSQGHLNPGGL